MAPERGRVRADTESGTRTDLPVTGMTCPACEARVEKVVGRIPGVAAARASSTAGRLSESWQPFVIVLELTPTGREISRRLVAIK